MTETVRFRHSSMHMRATSDLSVLGLCRSGAGGLDAPVMLESHCTACTSGPRRAAKTGLFRHNSVHKQATLSHLDSAF